ncbi:hypothetical protein HBB16_07270 [Pseudonocardia sp. MCCB 268]|nr:hypothetical protein [Pseudonocardia cytotoxica]
MQPGAERLQPRPVAEPDADALHHRGAGSCSVTWNCWIRASCGSRCGGQVVGPEAQRYPGLAGVAGTDQTFARHRPGAPPPGQTETAGVHRGRSAPTGSGGRARSGVERLTDAWVAAIPCPRFRLRRPGPELHAVLSGAAWWTTAVVDGRAEADMAAEVSSGSSQRTVGSSRAPLLAGRCGDALRRADRRPGTAAPVHRGRRGCPPNARTLRTHPHRAGPDQRRRCRPAARRRTPVALRYLRRRLPRNTARDQRRRHRGPDLEANTPSPTCSATGPAAGRPLGVRVHPPGHPDMAADRAMLRAGSGVRMEDPTTARTASRSGPSSSSR